MELLGGYSNGQKVRILLAAVVIPLGVAKSPQIVEGGANVARGLVEIEQGIQGDLQDTFGGPKETDTGQDSMQEGLGTASVHATIEATPIVVTRTAV